MDVKEVLGDKVLIKEIENSRKLEASGLTISSEEDHLPLVEIVMVSEDLPDKLKERVQVGVKAYYVRPREKGKVQHNGSEHFIVPISAIVAVL